MTARRLRARDRRALLLGLAILAPAAAYRVGVQPWLQYRSGLADALTAERDLYAREQAALRQAAGTSDAEGALRAALESADPWMVDGSSSLAASGALSRWIAEAGRTAGILVQDVQARSAAPDAGLVQTVTVAVRATGDLEGITRLLHTLENDGPLLEVRELSMRAAGVNDGDLERGQLLSVGFVVEGLWMPPDSDATAP